MNKNSKRKVAFTLAEVLITLGIIGVVSALILPALIANYEQTVLKNRFKKAYATFSNAYEYVKQKDFDGRQPECYYPSKYGAASSKECSDFWKSMDKELNIIKACNGSSIINRCIPQYNAVSDIWKLSYPTATQEAADQFGRNNFGLWGTKSGLESVYSRVLGDGSNYFLYTNNWNAIIFAIDVNGLKGPNKWGYDVFAFWFLNGTNKIEPYESQYFVEPGGKFPSRMIQEINQ